jgi:hypothetical protein
MGWPSPGNDPMYLFNTTQNYDRRYYYGVNSIPYLKIEGMYYTQSYSNYYNMYTPYSIRMGTPTPLNISVTELRLPGDTVQATVIVTNLSELPTGNYYLRVQALEKKIVLSPQPNGESEFHNVFRRAYPTSLGTSIPTTAGTYNYIIKYKIEPTWSSSQIYTIAFVQEDNSKEIFNCAGKWAVPLGIIPISGSLPKEFKLNQNYPNPFNPVTKIAFSIPKAGNITLKVFDVLGKEVANLVNNTFVKAGTYESEFNASNLSSGLYFYRLITDNFTDTKKMILTK